VICVTARHGTVGHLEERKGTEGSKASRGEGLTYGPFFDVLHSFNGVESLRARDDSDGSLPAHVPRYRRSGSPRQADRDGPGRRWGRRSPDIES
jgi:hypothetical protein